MEDNNIHTTAEERHARRSSSRAPRRREQDLSGIDMAHISESLEESISSYEQPAYKSRTVIYNAQPSDSTQTDSVSQPHSAMTQHAIVNTSHTQTSPIASQSHAVSTQHAAGSDTTAASTQRQKVRAFRSATDDCTEELSSEHHEPEPVQEKKRRRRHPVLKLILLLLVFGIGFVGYKFITGQSGYYTVAVFGVDSRNGNVGKEALSDVNIIARIDRASGEIKLVSLYRDTYTEIKSDGTYHKLNEAYFRGGPEQAVWAVEHNTDVKVDDYATFNWKAVADTINILGGVDLEITDAEFKYINAFITETVNSTGIGSYQLEHAGMNHLDGVQAVAYARLRLMDTDYQRTARQRKVIGLALDKAKNADYATLLNIVTTVMPQISTSVTPDDLIPFMKGVNKYYISDTAGFPFDKATQDVGKLDCVIPVTLESNAIKLHEFLYPDTPYSPSSGLKAISNHIIDVTGLSG